MVFEHHQPGHKDGGLQESRETQADDLFAPLDESISIPPGHGEHIKAPHGNLNQQNTAALQIAEKHLNDRIGHEDKAEKNHKPAGLPPKSPQGIGRLRQTFQVFKICQRRLCRIPDAGGPEAGDARRQGALQRNCQRIEPHRHLGKKRDGQKSLKDIQRRLFHIAPPSGILDAAFKHSHHQSRGKQGPAQIGEKQHHALHPVHLEELSAHAAHLRKEIPEKTNHLTVKPVHDLAQYFVRYKVPYKQ